MIVLGRAVAPYGLQGWLRVHAFGDDPLAWGRMQNLWVSATDDTETDKWQVCRLEQVKLHGNGVVVKFKDVSDRNAAERFAPCFIGAPREALPRPPSQEYYWADLLGLRVRNLQDAELGYVDALLESCANQVLVIKEGDRERLIPFVGPIVRAVELEAKMIRVDWDADW